MPPFPFVYHEMTSGSKLTFPRRRKANGLVGLGVSLSIFDGSLAPAGSLFFFFFLLRGRAGIQISLRENS